MNSQKKSNLTTVKTDNKKVWVKPEVEIIGNDDIQSGPVTFLREADAAPSTRVNYRS